jgi:hypothetical protein
MQLHRTHSWSILAVTAALLCSSLDISAGKPGPPRRNSPERRQANMLFLRFQDALAAGRWEEALSYCSKRIKASAASSASPKQFFTDTMPIEHVLAKDFGCWAEGERFYGMFATLSEPDVTPRLDWYWGFDRTATGWEVDYPPVKLDDYLARKKAALQERDERSRAIRASLEPKARGLATRLTPVSDRFVVGQPMLFRLELVNSGPTVIHYHDYGVRFARWLVSNERKETSGHGGVIGQIGVVTGKLAPNSSVVLAEKFDLNLHHSITNSGRYQVWFASREVAIGEPITSFPREPDRFGEDLSISGVFGLLTLTNQFPSNPVEIEVVR